jgi:sugar lactone lactonase YvrE
MRGKTSLVLAGMLLVAACSREPEPPPAAPSAAPPPAPPPAPTAAAPTRSRTILIERGGFIPEGIEYDQTNRRFLSGSLVEGSVFAIGEDGSLTAVVSDPDLVSSVGIEVDEDRGRLLVTNSDRSAFQPGNAGQAKLGIFNSTSGEKIAMVDLGAVIGTATGDPPRFFANDVTVDGDGNAYVTDTFQNVVYKVTPDFEASVLHRFGELEGGAALNGIVYHDGGFLLVVAGQDIYRVPLDNPAGTTQVSVTDPVAGQDGIVLTPEGQLAAVSNSTDEPQIVLFESTDDWMTARRAGAAMLNGQATTAAVVGNELWVVHPHFADADPPSLELAVFP